MVKLIGSICCRFFLSKYVHFTSLPSKWLIWRHGISARRILLNEELAWWKAMWRPLRWALYCTASVHSDLGFYLFFLFWLLVNHLRVFIFFIQFQHTYFCCLFYSWRSLFILVANVFIVLPCLQVSATVRRFLLVWVGLKKKGRNDVSRASFSMDATPYKFQKKQKNDLIDRKKKLEQLSNK